MTRMMVAAFVALALPVLATSLACAEQEVVEPIYRFDPALSIQGPRPTTISADPNVVIEQRDDKTTLHLQTEGPLTPYLDATRSQELSPEELRLLQDKLDDSLTDYHLEAGIGMRVEDNAHLNLGYRILDSPSMLDDRRNDPLSLSGDLRVTFDIKVPFD